MSIQVTLRSIACSHFIQAPCCRMATALLVCSSSTEACTSSCTSLCLSFPLAESYWVALMLPSPALPCATVPRMDLCFNQVSACWPASAVLPVLTTIPAPDTLVSLSVGHSESRRMTDELGSRQRDLSTSSVTKRANGHWHAIIASSCRWSQREYKRQPVHRINHPFATRSLRVRALRHSSGGRGLTGEQRSVKTVTQECAVASSPACFSTKRAKFL